MRLIARSGCLSWPTKQRKRKDSNSLSVRSLRPRMACTLCRRNEAAWMEIGEIRRLPLFRQNQPFTALCYYRYYLPYYLPFVGEIVWPRSKRSRVAASVPLKRPKEGTLVVRENFGKLSLP